MSISLQPHELQHQGLFSFPLSSFLLFLRLQLYISSVHSLSRVRLFATPWTVVCQASLSITNPRSLLKLMPIQSKMPSNHLILCCPLLLLPSIFPSIGSFPMSQIFASGGQSIGASASASVLPTNEYAGLISFRIDWFELTVQGTLKSLLQHYLIEIIHSLVLNLLYCPNLTSIHYY